MLDPTQFFLLGNKILSDNRERKRGTKIKRRKNVKEEGTVKNCGENETVRHREEKRRK